MAAPEESAAAVRALRPPADPSTLVLVISGRIAREDVPRLCERIRPWLDGSDADVVVCDVCGVVKPDAVAVEALARLQLTARRLGYRIRIRHACRELQDLLALTGLRDVFLCEDLSLDPSGKAEEREQPRGIEEEANSGDPTA
ncbi:MAG: STAS domain-containing protein [Actinomycetota bacterium]|nr:STAS domain-containing protein [Actinomycetota bacterium]